MNKCSIGDILFCWFVGIRKKEIEGRERYGLLVEVGDMMGNRGKLPEGQFKSSDMRLLEIIIKGSDVEEIKEGLDKIYKYFCMEFEEIDCRKEKMVDLLKLEYEKESYSQCSVFVKKMSCVGLELMHRDDMEMVINKNSMDNKKINIIGNNFLVIKLMERNFLNKFMNNGYGKFSVEKKKMLLKKNSIRLVFPIGQLEEIKKSF